MELIELIPVFNLYESFWTIYTKTDVIPPQYVAEDAIVNQAIIGEGAEIYGEVVHSIIGPGVVVKKGAKVVDSILMNSTVIGENAVVDKAIIAENCVIGKGCVIGCGEEAPNEFNAGIYNSGLVTIGEDTVIPAGISVGRNTAITGVTTLEDYTDNALPSGKNIFKEVSLV